MNTFDKNNKLHNLVTRKQVKIDHIKWQHQKAQYTRDDIAWARRMNRPDEIEYFEGILDDIDNKIARLTNELADIKNEIKNLVNARINERADQDRAPAELKETARLLSDAGWHVEFRVRWGVWFLIIEYRVNEKMNPFVIYVSNGLTNTMAVVQAIRHRGQWTEKSLLRGVTSDSDDIREVETVLMDYYVQTA